MFSATVLENVPDVSRKAFFILEPPKSEGAASLDDGTSYDSFVAERDVLREKEGLNFGRI